MRHFKVQLELNTGQLKHAHLTPIYDIKEKKIIFSAR